MQVKTTRDRRSIFKACPKEYTKIENSIFSWDFGENDMAILLSDEKSEELRQEVKEIQERGHRFYDPEACARMFFLAVEQLSIRKETDPLWRMYDAILVCASNGSTHQTGMEIVA